MFITNILLVFLSFLFLHSVTVKSQWVNTGCPYDYETHDVAIDANKIFMASNSHYVYRSLNYGQSWDQSNSGLGDQYTQTLAIINNCVFVGTEFSGAFMSSNNGNSWVSRNNGLSTYCVNVLRTDSTNIFAGTSLGGTLYKSTNFGLNWYVCSYEIIGNRTMEIAFLHNNIFLSLAGPGGILRSTNYGVNWSFVLGSGDSYGLSAINNYVFAGLGNNLYETTNLGVSWNLIGQWSGFDVYVTDILTVGNEIFVAAGRGGVYKANLGAYTWIPYNEGFPEFGHFVLCLSNDDVNLFAGLINLNGGNGVWKRKFANITPSIPLLYSPGNNSQGWGSSLNLLWRKSVSAVKYQVQVASDSLFNNLILNDTSDYDTLRHVSGLNSSTTYYWRVKSKNDAGSSPWSQVWRFSTLNAPAPTILFSPPNNSQGHGLAVSLIWYKSAITDFYWVQLALDSMFNTIVVNDSTMVDSLRNVAGLQNNIWYWWRVKGKNIAGWGTWSAVWKFRTGYVGLISHGNDIPKDFELHSNYPNPFNPVTNIKFDVPEPAFVMLKIYNILGEEIGRLVNENLEPGRYEVQWDGTNYPSGVYFYKFTSMTFVKIKKMVLLK